MERVISKGKTCIVGYHTQECRYTRLLEKPIICLAKTAWLGIGYYFWTELEFAANWGEDFKKATGYYDIYRAYLNTEHCINATFDEEGYFYFRRKIEETLNHFNTNGIEVSLDRVHRFLAENCWQPLGIDGIIFDDIPQNPEKGGRVHSEIPKLYYKKRIQIVIFSLTNIYNFEMLLEEQE